MPNGLKFHNLCKSLLQKKKEFIARANFLVIFPFTVVEIIQFLITVMD